MVYTFNRSLVTHNNSLCKIFKLYWQRIRWAYFHHLEFC